MKGKPIEVIDRELGEAVKDRRQGRQVLVLDEQRRPLYQTGFPKKMTNDLFEKLAAAGMASGGVVVRDVPAEYWNGSRWPEALNAARDEYLHSRFTTGRSGQSDS